MKKLLISFILVFIVGCAAPAVQLEKCKSTAPPPAPSKQEVLTKSKFESESKAFQAWWTEESVLFTAWLSEEVNALVMIEFKEVSFLHDYTVSIMYLHVLSDQGRGAILYLVSTKVDGRWNVTSIIGGETDPAVEEETL